MSQITIIPQHNIVCIDSVRVDVGHIEPSEPEILTIKFDTGNQKGVIEYCTPADGLTPAPLEIDNLEPWRESVEEAEEILFCRQNPKTFYSTAGRIGSPIIVADKGWPQPLNSTTEAPPARPSVNVTLYWDGTEFVWSAFPIDLDLIGAQNYVTNLVNDKAHALLQPSDWYVVRQSETGTAIPEEWNTWRAAVRDAAKAKKTAVSARKNLTSLGEYCKSPEFQTW